MEEKRKVPKIRFKGFTDDWEQHKLNKYLFVSCEKNNNNIYDKEDVLSVSGELGIVNQIELQGRSFAGASVSNYGIVNNGDVVYTKSPLRVNPYGIIKTNKGETGIVSTLYAVYKANEKANPFFIQTYFEQTARVNNYLHPLVNKGAKNDMKVSDENALLGDVIFPKLEEQTKIFAFFSKLDNIITLHQRKYNDLVNMKKSMLEKMFPKNSSKVPEIRFKEFTDDWEQRKLKDIGEILTGSTPSTSHEEYYSSNGMLWVTPTDIDSNIIKTSARKLSKEGEKVARIVPKNTILVTCIASIGKNALVLEKSSFNQQINSLTPFDNYNPYFLLTNSVLWSNKMKQQGAAGIMQIVNKNEFSELETKIPSENEQNRIGECFKQIDNLITLHQLKLEKLNNMKKSLLEKMFV